VISLKSVTIEAIDNEGFETLNTLLFSLFLSDGKDNLKKGLDQLKAEVLAICMK
jgi:hypothetical protein